MRGLRGELVRRGCLYPHNARNLQFHFIGTSGKHLGGYGNLDPILCDQRLLRSITGNFARAFGRGGAHFDQNNWPEVVVVPAVGEIALLHLLTSQLVTKLPATHIGGVWADKRPMPPGAPTEYEIVRPGFSREIRGKRALVVVDFCNSLHTARQLVAEVQRFGGRVVGVCAIVYNSTVLLPAKELGVPVFYALEPFSYPWWEQDACEPCAAGVPIVTDDPLGHGAEFRRQHADWPAGRFVRLLDG